MFQQQIKARSKKIDRAFLLQTKEWRTLKLKSYAGKKHIGINSIQQGKQNY